VTVRVQQNDFDLGREYSDMVAGDTSAGAVVAFVGRVRDFNESGGATSDVRAMTLEHYPAMTVKQLEAIEGEARTRWALTDSLIVHRYGRLTPGDQIVLVLTASSHRQDAFDAAQFLMDWLKTKAPFWKKEETPQGDRWVEVRDSDTRATARWHTD